MGYVVDFNKGTIIKILISNVLLLIFACSNSYPVESSKLAEREGLVYYNKSDTPFTGKGIKYWPTGEVQIKATFEEGILIQSSFLGMDGSLLESTEVIDDTTISIEWFRNGGKRSESKTFLGKKIHINRWNEDGTKRKELFDWEKELLEPNDQLDIPLKYIIKKPTNHAGKQNVLYFMHAYMQSLSDYKHHVINQFGDNFITIILQAPYETSIFSNKWTWFDFHISFFSDTTFNEEQINASCDAVLFSIDKIIEKEKINPKRIFVGGNSQGGIIACKLALEHPDAIDGFIAHNSAMPISYKILEDESKYVKLKGLVISGEYDETIDPINSKHIANTFLKLGADIEKKE